MAPPATTPQVIAKNKRRRNNRMKKKKKAQRGPNNIVQLPPPPPTINKSTAAKPSVKPVPVVLPASSSPAGISKLMPQINKPTAEKVNQIKQGAKSMTLPPFHFPAGIPRSLSVPTLHNTQVQVIDVDDPPTPTKDKSTVEIQGGLDISKIKPAPGSVQLDTFNINQGAIMKHKDLLENATYWHMFIVMNVSGLKRNTVLKAILNHVEPLDLIPVYYVKETHNKACFLARNCEGAIKKLAFDNLVVENPEDKKNPLKLFITLRFASTNEIKIDVSHNILKVLRKRIQFSTINLENFHDDPDLLEYCPLSQPKLLSYVLHLTRISHPSCLLLGNNEIRSLVSLEALWGPSSITSLDLRNNLIQSLTELEPLAQLKITDLYLEGNPLCDKYDEYSYVQRVKEYCPKIERLDGILLAQGGVPSFRRNFLCNSTGLDLVDQFLEYFFTSYDLGNRNILKSLYHRSALFSLTTSYIGGQISSINSHLSKYKVHSRNLLALADLSRLNTNLKEGSKDIIDLFNLLPPTEHDPYSFTVDLLYYTDSCAMVVVTGVYRELPENILDSERYLGFNRSFMLESINGEYCIINEQLHIFNALTGMQTKAFKNEVPIRPQFLPSAQTQKQKTQMVNAMKLITNLTTEWAKKCLEDCQYDLKRALSLFIDLYKVDKIPPDGIQT